MLFNEDISVYIIRIEQIQIDIDKMFRIARFVENILQLFYIDMKTPTVHNTCAVIISVG